MKIFYLIFIFFLFSISCTAQELELTIGFEFHSEIGDSIELYEIVADTTIIDTIITIPGYDTSYTFIVPLDDKRHYYVSKGYVSNGNYYTDFSNVLDTLLEKRQSPIMDWLKKKSNRALITWDSNIEPDLSGYNLYFGFRSKAYKYVINLSKINRYIFSLSEDRNYYIALTAYDVNGNESYYSEEKEIIRKE